MNDTRKQHKIKKLKSIMQQNEFLNPRVGVGKWRSSTNNKGCGGGRGGPPQYISLDGGISALGKSSCTV